MNEDSGRKRLATTPRWVWAIAAVTVLAGLLSTVTYFGGPLSAELHTGPAGDALIFLEISLISRFPWAVDIGGVFIGLETFILGLLTTLYLLPWVIAERRCVESRRSIVLIDVFLGWTVVGWIASLVMAAGPTMRAAERQDVHMASTTAQHSGAVADIDAGRGSASSLPGWAWLVLAVTGVYGLVALLTEGVSYLPIILLVALSTTIYLIPWIVADQRNVRTRGSIIVIDLFLGWTLIGWIVALAMAAGSAPRKVLGDAETPSATSPIAATSGTSGALTSATTGMKTCPRCAEEVKAAARVCRYCSHEFVEPLAAN